MAKRIKFFSKLSSKEKDNITTMLGNSELQLININSSADSKKGVIYNIDGDELLIIMDIAYKSKNPDFDDDDDDHDTDDVTDTETDDDFDVEDEVSDDD